MIPQFLMTTSS